MVLSQRNDQFTENKRQKYNCWCIFVMVSSLNRSVFAWQNAED